MTPRPDLSVLVVTWNVRELVLVCLDRVLQRCGDLAVEVIVVDNASKDGTAAALRERFPGIEVVENPANVGFPRANNLALARARGRHVLFLNPDTEVGDGTLERCVRALDGASGLGAVGCRLVQPDGRVQTEGGRRHYRLHHLLSEALYLHRLFPRSPFFAHHEMGDWDHQGARDVEALCGAFMMCRREAVLEVGGMPDEVFMYHEDLALSLRLEKAGWTNRYLGDVETLHRAGSSTVHSSSPLELLEGEVRVRLIRERSGILAGAAARFLFGVRSAARLTIGLVASLVPGVRQRNPRVVDLRKHARLLLWTVQPSTVRHALERSGVPRDERPGLVLVGPTPPPVHGVSAHTRLLVSALEVRERFRVFHVDTADRRDLKNLGRIDVRNVVLGLKHAVELAGVVRRERPAVVHLPVSQNAPAFARDALFILVASVGSARVVTHLHGGYFGTFYASASGPVRWLVRWAHRRVEQAWVLGEGLRPHYDGLLPPNRVRVVPNGVAEPFDDAERLKRATTGPLRVLFMGAVGRAKGVDVLLDAVEALSGRGADAHLTVAGPWASAEDRSVLEARLDEWVEAGRATVLGVVGGAAKARALSEADVFVLPTRYPYEGQPLAILEAMAARLPVVAAPRAAIPDMVEDGTTGILVAEGSAGALAEALERLASDLSLVTRLGEAGRTRWLAGFTREHTVRCAVEALTAAVN